MSMRRTAGAVLVSSALVAMACSEAPHPGPGRASGMGGVANAPAREWPGSIDLSGEAYSLPSGVAVQGGSIWVSNYVNGGTGPGPRLIYRYDLATRRSTGSIPAPSDWTGGLGFDGTALLATNTVQLFRLAPETGDVLSSFPIAAGGSCWGIAWDGARYYVADYTLTASGYATRITRYSASGAPSGVIVTRDGSFIDGGPATAFDAIRGLAYHDGTLWALVSPRSAGAPYRLLNLSVDGAELSSVEIPDTAGRDLGNLGYDGSSFWTIELLPMSIADFSQGKRLIPFRP
jgi:hypothetical protein